MINQYSKEADQLYEEKKYSRALKDYYKIIQIDKENQRATYNIACMYVLTNNNKDAVSWLKFLFELNPKMIKQVENDPDFAGILQTPEYRELKLGYLPASPSRP